MKHSSQLRLMPNQPRRVPDATGAHTGAGVATAGVGIGAGVATGAGFGVGAGVGSCAVSGAAASITITRLCIVRLSIAPFSPLSFVLPSTRSRIATALPVSDGDCVH